MKLKIQVDKRQLWQGNGANKSEAFRKELVEAVNNRFGGDLSDAIGKKLDGLTVEVGDYGFTQVESSSANVDLVKRVVRDLISTTTSRQLWRQ
ncbi:hypothetical protein FHU10_2525 [Serratia fonticola]|uniref:Uncharacterized protein n=1 Tax=Serratia fonticola TaxID=47917 RepID=A0A559T5U3_SERFO|nr:hypothetical protein [Serratia fonticola]TQI82497.1 hypothetical protein FHU09_5184 [Serratia fonticola]TQI95484.1 hypothetical protein FHU11_0866 [Serratia fonticola]TVZ69979.1 hypothetical protein FHU10_2525 [Serratia fonticola]